jgi:hypothetical protein
MPDPRLMSKLVSPHAFDGAGPVPDEVKTAGSRVAELHFKFVLRPGGESPLTTREVAELFTASATIAEWLREVTEARDLLAAEVERLREIELRRRPRRLHRGPGQVDG